MRQSVTRGQRQIGQSSNHETKKLVCLYKQWSLMKWSYMEVRLYIKINNLNIVSIGIFKLPKLKSVEKVLAVLAMKINIHV